jgi:acyl dehydratase
VTPYGLFTQPSNTGSFRRGAFDFVSEVNVNLGYQFTRHVGAFVGYTFLYWNNPVRAGDQVETAVAPGQQAALPTIPFTADHFWAQGVNIGLDFRW